MPSHGGECGQDTAEPDKEKSWHRGMERGSLQKEAIKVFEICDRDTVAVADPVPRVEWDSVHDMKFIDN